MSVSPPRPKMPHLNALRAFEAAARLSSFSAAAQELFVTPAAVAQHVKSLEGWAGAELFKRNPQGIELTTTGAVVKTEFEIAFDVLGSAVHKLRTSAAPQEIRIAALPSVAQLWLSPRLPKIRSAMPDISISVSALERRPNLVRDPFDLAIFYEDAEVSSDSTVIYQDVIFPVCAPVVAGRLKDTGDLVDEIFLHDTTWRQDWRHWLSEASPHVMPSKAGPEFSLYSLALEECKNGAGILIGHAGLVSSQIADGSLVAPFEEMVRLPKWLTIDARDASSASVESRKVMEMLLANEI